MKAEMATHVSGIKQDTRIDGKRSFVTNKTSVNYMSSICYKVILVC